MLHSCLYHVSRYRHLCKLLRDTPTEAMKERITEDLKTAASNCDMKTYTPIEMKPRKGSIPKPNFEVDNDGKRVKQAWTTEETLLILECKAANPEFTNKALWQACFKGFAKFAHMDNRRIKDKLRTLTRSYGPKLDGALVEYRKLAAVEAANNTDM